MGLCECHPLSKNIGKFRNMRKERCDGAQGGLVFFGVHFLPLHGLSRSISHPVAVRR